MFLLPSRLQKLAPVIFLPMFLSSITRYSCGYEQAINTYKICAYDWVPYFIGIYQVFLWI